MRTLTDLGAAWRFAPPLEEVESIVDELPGAPANARGAYLGDHILIGRDRRAAQARAAAHEVVGHHGPRILLGAGWPHFAAAVSDGARCDAQLDLFMAHVQRAYDPGMPRVCTADEVIAAAAEYAFSPIRGQIVADAPWRSRLVAAARHMGRRWLHLPLAATHREVEGVLLAAEHVMLTGGNLLHRAIWGYDSPMAKPMGPKNPATSIEESQRLLEGARQQEQWWPETKAFLGVASLFVIIPAGVFCFGYAIWSALSLLGRLLH